MKALALTLAMLFLVGCAGDFDMYTDGVEHPTGWGAPAPNEGVPHVTSPESEELTPGFALQREELRLLPFHVRMQKLTRVTGLSSDDALFDQVWRSRYDLGDHNYGQGIGPDLSWNASKMSTWVRALRPVCSSEAMATRYASFPADLGALIEAAYGRAATSEDLAMFEEVLAGQQLDEAAHYEAVCVSVLTSSEFVAQ